MKEDDDELDPFSFMTPIESSSTAKENSIEDIELLLGKKYVKISKEVRTQYENLALEFNWKIFGPALQEMQVPFYGAKMLGLFDEPLSTLSCTCTCNVTIYGEDHKYVRSDRLRSISVVETLAKDDSLDPPPLLIFERGLFKEIVGKEINLQSGLLSIPEDFIFGFLEADDLGRSLAIAGLIAYLAGRCPAKHLEIVVFFGDNHVVDIAKYAKQWCSSINVELHRSGSK